MDVHTPKPWHGRRELLKEIGTIVLGVLIALGAEQTVQALDWSHKARLAEDLMRAEIAADDGPQVYFRIATARCWIQSLTDLRGQIEGGAARDVLAARVQASRSPNYTWDAAAYRAADSSGALVHLPRNLLSELSQFYELMPDLNAHSAAEANSLAHLHALSTKGGPLSEAERMSLLTTVEELLNEQVWIRSDTLNAADAMTRAGVKLDRSGQSVFDKTMAYLQLHRPEFAECVAKGRDDLKKVTGSSNGTRYFIDPLDPPTPNAPNLTPTP